MLGHLRANLWLLVLTIVICCVAYPLLLLGIGQTIFPDRANGSLVTDADGKVIGSRLVAQAFSGDEYFQPRPSAVSYNAAATGGSNLGPNNPALRARVLGMLGGVLKYGPKGPKPGKRIGPDIEAWFQKDRYQGKPGIVTQWASANASSAEGWIKSTGDAVKGQWKKDDKEPDPGEAFLSQWTEDLPELHKRWLASEAYADWKKKNPDKSPEPADLASGFFETFSQMYPGEWPALEEYETKDKEKRKKLARMKESPEIQNNFFAMWRQEHPNLDLASVPADMVMTSGSGLDPHITLKNALYQLDRVADKWAETTKRDPGQVRKEIESYLRANTQSPLGGLVGEELINVLETNLALHKKYGA
jgi:K+-transporting ATPase ATPase C chain